MRITITGATGLIGRQLVSKLAARGDEVTVLSRDPVKARRTLPMAAEFFQWQPDKGEPPRAEALMGRDAVVHLAGAPMDQRWTDEAKDDIRRSRVQSTKLLVTALRNLDPRPATFVSASAIGYYGPHGSEVVDESSPPGKEFLAQVCVAWETAARAADELGIKTVQIRNGVVMDDADGALARMLPVFRRGIGGPVAGGKQYLSWIHLDDLTNLYIKALDSRKLSGPINGTAPNPVTNREFSKALGHVLGKPSFMPVPGFALRLLYGEMAAVVTTGQNVKPVKALDAGFSYRFSQIRPALEDAVS